MYTYFYVQSADTLVEQCLPITVEGLKAHGNTQALRFTVQVHRDEVELRHREHEYYEMSSLKA